METEHLIDLLFSPDVANIQLALALIAQQPRLAQNRDLVLALVWLKRLVNSKELHAQVLVSLHSFADKRLVKRLDDTFSAVDYARNNSNINWLIFERSWGIYEQCREEYDVLLSKNKKYLQIYEEIARYLFHRFQQTDLPLRLFRFVMDKQAASELGELNYTYLLFQYYFSKYEHLDELDRSVEIIERAAQQQLRQKDLFYNVAGYIYHTYKKEYERAEYCYKKALEVNPQHDEVAHRLAVLYMERQPRDAQSAQFYIEQAIANSPENYEYRLMAAAVAWRGLGDQTAAENLLLTLLQDHARQPDVWHWAGKFYSETARPQQAEQAYKNGLKLQPKSIPILEGLVEFYTQENQPDKTELYQQQLRLLKR